MLKDENREIERLLQTVDSIGIRKRKLKERAIAALETVMPVFEDALRSASTDLDTKIEVAQAVSSMIFDLSTLESDESEEE